MLANFWELDLILGSLDRILGLWPEIPSVEEMAALFPVISQVKTPPVHHASQESDYPPPPHRPRSLGAGQGSTYRRTAGIYEHRVRAPLTKTARS